MEGDWPDCWRINRWVRGYAGQVLDAYGLLACFERWPTCMWASQDIAEAAHVGLQVPARTAS